MKTPCYIINQNELDASLYGFKNALTNHFSHSIPSYSVKTNSLPYLLKKAKDAGYFAEVVSEDEYELALECGFPKEHIIYNGPLKSKETFIDAINNGALVNIETWREFEWLRGLDIKREYKIGLRMNINISQISPADENHPDDNSRFGFSCESGDFDKAIELINSLPKVRLNRIHIHRTSCTRSVDFYCNLVRYAMNELNKRNLNVEYVDIGGGYFGIMPGKPTYEEYASAISKTLQQYLDLNTTTVIVEPGNAIVASCFDFMASVIDVKRHDNAYYVTIDGSRIDIDPFFHKDRYFNEFICQNPGQSPIVYTQIVGGCTCLEYDRLMILNNKPLLRIGDQIRFMRVGAYTMTLTPLFIRYWPIVYVDSGNDLLCVREKWGANKLL